MLSGMQEESKWNVERFWVQHRVQHKRGLLAPMPAAAKAAGINLSWRQLQAGHTCCCQPG